MNAKKRLEDRIKGWLPKEPNIAKSKFSIRKLNIKIQRKPPTLNDRLVGGLGGAGGAGVLSGILFYFLSPTYSRSLILAEEVVGMILLSLAFSVWVKDRNKKQSAKNNTATL